MSEGAGATQPVWPPQVGDRSLRPCSTAQETGVGVSCFAFFFFFHLISRFYLFSMVLGLQNNRADDKKNSKPPAPSHRHFLSLTVWVRGALLLQLMHWY